MHGHVLSVNVPRCELEVTVIEVCVGLTPFAPGQWQGFLARVAGLLALQQLLRPFRFSCAVALTPLVDRMMGGIQRRLGTSKRKAFVVMLGLLAVVTTACFAAALTTVTVLNMPKSAV